MHQHPTFRGQPRRSGCHRALLALLIAALLGGPTASGKSGNRLFTQEGKDPSFEQLVKDGTIPTGRSSDEGVAGSTIDVNNERIERGPTGDNPIPKAIRLHTLCNRDVEREDFARWSRWYQEDGNTQVFRLFKGEHNVRTKAVDECRVQAYSELKWKRGDWHRWDGTYTIIGPHACTIFQVRNSSNDWAVKVEMTSDGSIVVSHKDDQPDAVVAKKMVGKPFLLTVRDNGHDYEVYFNKKLVGKGVRERPKGYTSFRWGMLGKPFEQDAMLFVTGAKFE